MKKSFIFISSLTFIGCTSHNAMPLGNDLMRIDVSGRNEFVSRSRAQKKAFFEAANATLKEGYDLFTVVENSNWSNTEGYGASGSSLSANNYYASGRQSSFWGISNRPEISLVIKIFKYNDLGSEKAVDARTFLNRN